MKKLFRILKRLILTLLVVILIWVAFNFSLVLYGIGQLKGQLHIVMNARSLKEVMEDKSVTDSTRQKLNFIEEIKKFAIDSLGLKPSDNYTTFYDQENKPLLWVLTASDPFKINAYKWKFPLLGSVSYKGYFVFEKGRSEELVLRSRGFDTDYGEVSAWSTLGWFKDPILSNMIRRSNGQLAELIIHEMTHSTLYLKSNVDLNENLASVCGEQGAIRFLQSKYGIGSSELNDYIFRKEDYDRFSNHMLVGTQKLDSLYTVMNDSLVIRKKATKDKLIHEIVKALDTVSFHSPKRYKGIFKNEPPNNAYFLNFVRYDAQKDKMREELLYKFNGNIKDYIEHLRKEN